MTPKIIVANYSALQKKYGGQNLKTILDGVRRLIAADKSRGIASRVVDISSADQMKTYKGTAVTSQTSERQAKDAVDAIYAATKADYLVLLDSWDVIPHLVLDNRFPRIPTRASQAIYLMRATRPSPRVILQDTPPQPGWSGASPD
jgi:hypothetical protein